MFRRDGGVSLRRWGRKRGNRRGGLLGVVDVVVGCRFGRELERWGIGGEGGDGGELIAW